MHYVAGILLIGEPGAAIYEKGLPLAAMLERAGYRIGLMEPVSGERQTLEEKMIAWADQMKLDLILIMGGISQKPGNPVTEAAEAVCGQMIPEIAEAMAFSGTAGIRNESIILNLPGTPQTAKEILQPVLPALQQALSMLK